MAEAATKVASKPVESAPYGLEAALGKIASARPFVAGFASQISKR